ncbi:hypothetical protein GCM10009304_28100 [Pseudomonas matsuisoli]|uniref:Transposase IS200-like domain-containing protein n=2 Tax=Pseudomonas matsuisoli TaxID=1515666 RepID=A0A917PZ60_9PSED|nr:hypothetical protein GCM10009304_28100 [Pseudomonas matsuisoli]
MRALHNEHLVKSLAWVVMPDHLHWLFELGNSVSVSTVVQRLKGASARQIRERTYLTETLWQRGFHDHALRHDEDIADIARYIVANPLRAG